MNYIERARKNFTFGFDDFERMKEKYYIDKSLFIEELSENKKKLLLITRPRRSGKTLTLSMTKYFFDSTSDNSYLFKDLKIHSSKAYELRNTVIVISLNFRSIRLENKSIILESFLRMLEKYFESNHEECENSFVIRGSFSKLYQKQNLTVSDVVNLFEKMIIFLAGKYEKKVLILIDEYDRPFRHAAELGLGEFASDIISSFFLVTIKTQSLIYKTVAFGVLDVQLGKNIRTDINTSLCRVVDNAFCDKIGLTDAEIKEMLANLKLEELRYDLSLNFKSYNTIHGPMYCPWQVFTYIDSISHSTTEHNFEVGSVSRIKLLIKKLTKCDFTTLLELLKNRKITSEIEPQPPNSLISRDELISALIFEGYLSFSLEKDNTSKLRKVFIPNKRRHDVFEEGLYEWILSISDDDKFNEAIEDIKNDREASPEKRFTSLERKLTSFMGAERVS